jgi:DNA-binding NtrC family response regulator
MRILHVEDDPLYAGLVSRLLTGRGRPVSGCSGDLEIHSVGTAREALRAVSQSAPALILLDYRLPDGNGVEVLGRLRTACPAVPVILLSVVATPRLIVEAMHAGATEYLLKDEDLAALLPEVVARTLERAARSRPRPSGPWSAPPLQPPLAPSQAADSLLGLVGPSRTMEKVRAAVRIAAASTAPVLIEGETGTGKELVARAIHDLGARHQRPFVPVNCAAIPETLAESEFFGHTRGAFTGAHRDKDGLFDAAAAGTLFLDEIEDLPLLLQAKLLRVLQDAEYRPIGSNVSRRADVRVIAASNQSPARLVQEGRLRADLYYRLRVLSIVVPPLRLRREDIPALAAHFVHRFDERHGTGLGVLPPAFVGRLCAAPWPGNVRELENTLESLCAGAHAGRSTLAALIAELPRGTIAPSPLDDRTMLLHTLEIHHWSRQAAARSLGISRVTLWRRMVKLGIRKTPKGGEAG